MYGNDVPTISKVSHSSIASCEGRVPSRPIVPVVYGLSSGTAGFSKQRFRDRRAQDLRDTLELVAGRQRAAAGQNHDLLSFVQDIGGLGQITFVRHACAVRAARRTYASGCSASIALLRSRDPEDPQET